MHITELVRGLSEDEIKQGLDEARSIKNENKIKLKNMIQLINDFIMMTSMKK